MGRNTQIVEISCSKCGVSFWITEKHNHELLKFKNTFYCPNGHGQVYIGESYEEKIHGLEKLAKEKGEKIDRFKKIMEQTSGQLENEQVSNKQLARSNSALRGVITRMKKRR